MATPVRNLVPSQLNLPLGQIQNFTDKVVSKFISIFNQRFSELIYTFANVINTNMTNRFGDTIYGLLQFGTGGFLVIPVLTSDPTGIDLVNGAIWVNSTTGQFKIRVGGVTKVVTIT